MTALTLTTYTELFETVFAEVSPRVHSLVAGPRCRTEHDRHACPGRTCFRLANRITWQLARDPEVVERPTAAGRRAGQLVDELLEDARRRAAARWQR